MNKIPRKLKPFTEKPPKHKRWKIRSRKTLRFNLYLWETLAVIVAIFGVVCFCLGEYQEFWYAAIITIGLLLWILFLLGMDKITRDVWIK